MCFCVSFLGFAVLINGLSGRQSGDHDGEVKVWALEDSRGQPVALGLHLGLGRTPGRAAPRAGPPLAEVPLAGASFAGASFSSQESLGKYLMATNKPISMYAL